MKFYKKENKYPQVGDLKVTNHFAFLPVLVNDGDKKCWVWLENYVLERVYIKNTKRYDGTWDWKEYYWKYTYKVFITNQNK